MIWLMFGMFWFVIRAVLTLGHAATRTVTPRRTYYPPMPARPSSSSAQPVSKPAGQPEPALGGQICTIVCGGFAVLALGLVVLALGMAGYVALANASADDIGWTIVIVAVVASIAIAMRIRNGPKPPPGFHGGPGHTCPDPDRPHDPPATPAPPDEPAIILPERIEERPYKWRPYQKPLLDD
jgi:hypothetical protein